MAQISIMTTIMYTMWMNGCKFGRKAVEQIMEGGKSNRVIEAAFMLGTLVIYENPYCCCFLAKSLEQGMFSKGDEETIKKYPRLLENNIVII